jgi:hypothetical protein
MDDNTRARPILQKAYDDFQELNESSSFEIESKPKFDGVAVFLAITFLVITILLAGLSYGYCRSSQSLVKQITTMAVFFRTEHSGSFNHGMI